VSNKDWLLHCERDYVDGLTIISIFETDSWRKKELILTTSKKHPYATTALKLSPATPYHLAISWKNREDNIVSAIYDIKTIQPLMHFNGDRILGFSPDGTVLAVHTKDGNINLFRTNEKVPFTSLPYSNNVPINPVILMSNTMITLKMPFTELRKEIQFVDITTQKKIHTMEIPNGHLLPTFTLTSNGNLLMASGRYSNFRTEDATITLRDPITMNATRTLSTGNCAHHVTLLPNEQEIIACTGLYDGIDLFVYDDRDEKTGSFKILSADQCPNDTFTVSPDGAAIISASKKGLTYYDLQTLKQEAEEQRREEAEEQRREEALTRLRLPHWLTPSPEPRLTIASRVQNFKELQAQ
jgi:WD40 repeat protein